MWMIRVFTFFALSPRPYMITPQLTEQYGHVLRVSVVRDNLKARTSASATPGEMPNPTIEDEPIPAAQILKNCLRFMGAFMNPVSRNVSRLWRRQHAICHVLWI